MTVRAVPNIRLRRLGAEVRRMREAAGYSASEAARRLGLERSRISNMEAGRLGITADRVRTLASVYECGDRDYVDALVAMAEEKVKGWWEEQRGRMPVAALELAELEHHAHGIRALQVTHFPGLLQTEEYAKAVFSVAVPEPTSVELRRILSFRMRRRDVLDREDSPPVCTFLIHETALRLDFGGPAVMRSQITHVLEASERPNVTVRVLPFAAGGFPNAGTSISLIAGPVPQLDTVQFDSPIGTVFVDAPAALRRYRETLDRIEERSLDVADSRDFLRDLSEQL